MNEHEKYMQRCLQLAKNGLGTTYPNPLVGSVIVYKDRIIGEGWHKKSGEAHAEVHAINSVVNRKLLQEATLYVNLEPCSHFGKTPPCCDLIIKNNIQKVVVGTRDPNVIVSGRGIKRLEEHGIDVSVGILTAECNEVNKRFFTYQQQKRPYVILKWAESGDGYISPAEKSENKPVYLTNKYSRQLVHRWRAEEQSILIGTQTAIDDNPRLDIRTWSGENPVRIVLDRAERISKDSHIYDKSQKTIVFTEKSFFAAAENLIFEVIDFSKHVPSQVLAALYKHQILSVIVEGGLKTLQSFIDAGLWDEARIFKALLQLENGTKAPVLKGTLVSNERFLKDELLIFRNNDQYDNF